MKTYINNEESRDKLILDISKVVEKLSKEAKIEALFRSILIEMGLPFEHPSFLDTPFRLSKMYCKELFTSVGRDPDFDITSFPSEGQDQYIVAKGIPYCSTCSHHFLPFIGKVDIVYHPGNKLVGLSKLARVVKFFSRRPQVQEEFATQIADYLNKTIEPVGILVRVTGKHTCVLARGAESDMVVTSQAIRGSLDKTEATELLKGGL